MMPRIRRRDIPRPLLEHLLDRIREHEIPVDQLGLLADRLDTEPDVPHHKWFKRFPGVTVCGEGELIKTFLKPGQIPDGDQVG